MNDATLTLEADLTFVDDRFEAGVRVDIVGDRIAALRRGGGGSATRLKGKALMPGFVNAHSHAFQRALRGLGETFPAGAGSFWTWREAMYSLVERMTPAEFRRTTARCFREMLAAGITTVGEFHYFHHVDIEKRDFEFDRVVLEAAAETGIRVALLVCYYRTGAIGKPLTGGQRRFETNDVAAFCDHVDRLAANQPKNVTLGIAPHSVRAVPTDDLIALVAYARRHGYMIHIHVEEQRREIEECQAAYGMTPMSWLRRHVKVGPDVVIVHATHTQPDEMDGYIAAGGRVCVCPITEGNLGDGIGDPARMLRRSDAVCVGTDSNVRLDFCEELRWMEFVQRLKGERRGVVVDEDGDVAKQLLRIGIDHGAAALNLDVGRIEAGKPADMIAIDLNHIALVGATPASLPTAFLLGAGGACVTDVMVAGQWVVRSA